jgi:Zn-dependent peptidase ImmA (M78 family)
MSELSVDLRDTIHLCQRRQDWFHEFAVSHGFREVDFVGSASVSDDPCAVADLMRRTIRFGLEERRSFSSWEDALRRLIDLIEAAGVLVSVNGVVGSDNHRVLDPNEFGGFTLIDSYAPLIFVNASDTKAAQIFTIVHELAHVWLGESAISDAGVARASRNSHEVWCNQVAAEVLIPRAELTSDFRGSVTVEELDRLARVYRVSTLVVLLRLREVGRIRDDDFEDLYSAEVDRVEERARERRETSGGNYYYTQPIRLGRRFAQAVIKDAYEGGTAYGEAYRLLGTAKPATFNRLAAELGVA